MKHVKIYEANLTNNRSACTTRTVGLNSVNAVQCVYEFTNDTQNEQSNETCVLIEFACVCLREQVCVCSASAHSFK